MTEVLNLNTGERIHMSERAAKNLSERADSWVIVEDGGGEP